MSKVTPPDFFDWFDECLRFKGWSDRQLASHAGISPSVISKARNRVKGIGWDAAVAIATALEVEPEVVFTKLGLKKENPRVEGPALSEMMSLFGSLSDEDQEEMIQMARLKLERQKRVKVRGRKQP